MIELILGGARSGKSALAEQRAVASGLSVVYMATGQSGDSEMTARITHHRVRRPPLWITVEEPVHLAAVLGKHASVNHCIVVDCLTLWLSNLLFTGKAAQQAEAGEPITCSVLKGEVAALFDCAAQLPGQIIFVSNEVGMGIVPLGAVNRLFVDEQGRLNQGLAQRADRVTLVAAGLPLVLK